MKVLKILYTSTFDEKMDRLRMECFPGSYHDSTAREAFDDHSWFPLIQIDGELAAYGRLTPGPNAVFETWTRGKAEVPTGAKVADLGRCLVSPAYRGIDLLQVVCLEAFLIADERGFDQIVGAVIPDRRLAEVLYELGFRNSGPVVEAIEPNRIVHIQPLVTSVPENIEVWVDKKKQLLSRIEDKGFEVIDRG